jgi:hypothetical protein
MKTERQTTIRLETFFIFSFNRSLIFYVASDSNTDDRLLRRSVHRPVILFNNIEPRPTGHPGRPPGC